MPLDVVFHCRGVELLAVMKCHAVTQLEGNRLAVGRPFVARRQLGNDVELLVDIDQLVAQRRKNNPANEGARLRWIQDIRILRQANTQNLCRRKHWDKCHQCDAERLADTLLHVAIPCRISENVRVLDACLPKLKQPIRRIHPPFEDVA